MTMQADYILEREGISTLEVENGFATYKKVSDNTYYLIDIYVKPEHRRGRIASEMSAKVAEIAKNDGAEYLLGSVDTSCNFATESMKAVLGDGFSFKSIDGNMIYFYKRI